MHIITPNLINEVRFGLIRHNGSLSGTGQAGVPFAQQNNFALFPGPVLGFGTINFNFSGVQSGTQEFTTIGGGDLNNNIETRGQLGDNVTWTRGKHAFKFGVDLRNARLNTLRGSPVFAQEYYGAIFSSSSDAAGSGLPFADFLMGYPSSILGAPMLQWGRQRDSYFGGFVQDDWKINSKLVLNLGVRYELYTEPIDSRNAGSLFDIRTGKYAIPCTGGYSCAIVDGDHNNWGPRVGASYQISSRFVARGGYGIFYGLKDQNQQITQFSDNPPKTWHRPSFAEWEDVEPPHDFSGYPESLDWLQHRIDKAYDLFDWRVELYRRLDPKHLITCHGVAGTLESYPSASHNEWMAAKRVDIYGLTWVQSRHGTEPWRQWQSFDLTRAGARGKPFWHAEAQGGPLWMQPQLIGKPREDGRVTEPEDVRIWNMISFAGGARGLLYCRYRSLLDGSLFGAFGAIGMDGSVTPRAEMVGKTLRWANANPEIWKSRPIRGDVGLLFVPEVELFSYVQQLSTDFYLESMRGAYQAFFDQNIQPDFVALENIDEYKLIYLAYPIMMTPETVAKLKEYVRKGGTLISEGLPAYFGEHGHVGQVQPNYGLDAVFGARETYVEFLADIHDNLKMEVNGNNVYGRYFFQQYETNAGKAVGHYPNGAISAVENKMGDGRTLLMGSFPGGGYYLHHGKETRTLFASFLKMAGVSPRVTVDDNEVQARVHQGAGGTYLWVTNPTMTARPVTVSLNPGLGRFSAGEDRWGKLGIKLSGQQVTVNVPARDAAVIALR